MLGNVLWGDRLVVAGPAGARTKLGFRIEQGLVAADASVRALLFVIPIVAGERPFGSLFTRHVILHVGQLLPPLLGRFHDLLFRSGILSIRAGRALTIRSIGIDFFARTFGRRLVSNLPRCGLRELRDCDSNPQNESDGEQHERQQGIDVAALGFHGSALGGSVLVVRKGIKVVRKGIKVIGFA